MKSFCKILGALVVLLGVVILACYHFGFQSNAVLLCGGVTMVVGFFLHIILNKKIQD